MKNRSDRKWLRLTAVNPEMSVKTPDVRELPLTNGALIGRADGVGSDVLSEVASILERFVTFIAAEQADAVAAIKLKLFFVHLFSSPTSRARRNLD